VNNVTWNVPSKVILNLYKRTTYSWDALTIPSTWSTAFLKEYQAHCQWELWAVALEGKARAVFCATLGQGWQTTQIEEAKGWSTLQKRRCMGLCPRCSDAKGPIYRPNGEKQHISSWSQAVWFGSTLCDIFAKRTSASFLARDKQILCTTYYWKYSLEWARDIRVLECVRAGEIGLSHRAQG